MFDIQEFKTKLRECDALRDDDVIQDDAVERIRPEREDEWPSELDSRVRKALSDSEIPHPYWHQAEAIRKSLAGADVVLESPTASGKTLAFTTPMLHFLKSKPGSHAMMIYPMKALAFDQRSQIDQLCRRVGIESFPYDGDTDPEHRKLLRQNPPQILLTNPEYLNMSFLAHKNKWNKFLQNLRYVVIDEMHEYHGFFGGNMALLLRRFFLHLNRIGASPRVFLSTATCANPKEHAENLTGRNMEVISARNALRPKRHFSFVKPSIPDFRYKDILRLRVENAALCALVEGLQTLVFCPTKKFLEEAFSNCRKKADERDFDPQRISAFHADLKSEERQKVQQKIKKGEIDVVFTTNALELGLDIGGLDGIILAGFPPRLSSAWQQIGRAGRSWDKDAFVLFYAMNDPIDRFFVGNLDAFLNKPFDELVVDPNNEKLIENHLPMLVAETDGKVKPDDGKILGGAFYGKAKDVGKPPKGPPPHPRLNIRGNIGQSYKLKRGNEEIGQISAIRRFREAYIGAIFTFFGQKYRVHSHEKDAVVLTGIDSILRTEAGFFTTLNENVLFDGLAYGEIEMYYGSLNTAMNFTGYKLLDEGGEEIEKSDANEAYYQNNLNAFWIHIPQRERASAGIGALEHMIRVGAMFVIPADRFDTSTYSKSADYSTAYYYENYPGGIGVARKLFDVWPTALRKGMEIAENCSCRRGCQNCIEPAKSWNVSNTEIDKAQGLELAKQLLEAEKNGPSTKLDNGIMKPVKN